MEAAAAVAAAPVVPSAVTITTLQTVADDECAPREWFVGQRVVDEEGNRATVRYIGPVASAKDATATWIGVEWDDPSRGKHDGSVLGRDGQVVRHFTCALPGPTSASFLKPAKLDRGVAFMEVLHRRYVGMDAPLEAPNRVFEGAYANTGKGRKKVIEFHGEEQIRARQQIGQLAKVSMRGERVAWAGAEAVAEEAAHLVEVDVQGNLWADWDELGRLARQMPRLEVLHLNSNRMMALPRLAPGSPLRQNAFPALRVLVLNNCGIAGWSTVLNLERCLPCLEELGLARNDLSRSDLALALADRHKQQQEQGDGEAVVGRHVAFHKLQSLDLSGTGLVRWGQVALLRGLPELRSLSLNENELEAVGADADGEDGEEEEERQGREMGFARLESLQLSCNRIGRWATIDALASLPALRSLRFTSNPLVRGLGPSEARQLLIARVATLTRLNGAEVSQRERVDAEKSYLRRVARELGRIAAEEEKEEGDGKQRLLRAKAEHPRWEVLLRLHGEALGMWPDGALLSSSGASGGAGSGASTLAREMLSVTLVSTAASSMTAAPVARKLPGSLTVAQLKQLCHKVFGLEPALQVLYYRPAGDDAGAPPTMLDADDETLAYIGVPASDCRVFMNERDLQQEAREAAQRAEAEQARLEEQMRQVDMMDRLKRQQVGLDVLATKAAATGGVVGVSKEGVEEQL